MRRLLAPALLILLALPAPAAEFESCKQWDSKRVRERCLREEAEEYLQEREERRQDRQRRERATDRLDTRPLPFCRSLYSDPREIEACLRRVAQP